MKLTSLVAPAVKFKTSPRDSFKKHEHTVDEHQNNISADITINSEKLEELTSFKFFGATLPKDCTSTAEVRIRIAMATAAMARLSKRTMGCYRYHCSIIHASRPLTKKTDDGNRLAFHPWQRLLTAAVSHEIHAQRTIDSILSYQLGVGSQAMMPDARPSQAASLTPTLEILVVSIQRVVRKKKEKHKENIKENEDEGL
ncbi:hypothetical protein DPMN_142720 [Dreissena polymorpha]|uniref:Uncharacterized protein n=1 Tax=Dreissena polymorpha TaxID=45954 RepID=A0A9D4GEX6_DREPO|nr:hypothetical protein DPMN_142720 [Dreissena polymorpha]